MGAPGGAAPGAGVARPKVKVAVLIGTLEVGGAELDIVRNFPRLNRDEFEVVVVCFAEAGTLAPELERQGIRVVARKLAATGADEEPQSALGSLGRLVHAIPEDIKRPLRRVVKAFFAMPPIAWMLRQVGASLYIAYVTHWVGRTFRAERVDIAHFFLPHSYAYGMFACRFWRPTSKTVMSRLSLNFYKDALRFLAWLERNVLHRRLDIAIGNSKLILDELVEEGVAPDKVRLLYNGINPAPFVRHAEDRARARDALGVAQDAFAMAAVGNLWAHKGHRDLIEACNMVRDQLPEPWALLIAGRDEQGNRIVYEELIAEYELAGRIRFLGPCDNVPQLLSAADVFVQPSHHEGLPNAIVEAMAASLPVVGTTVGGLPEVVRVAGKTTEPGERDRGAETGWLVPPRDPGALATALLEAAADPERRQEMGERARERVVAEFSLEKSVSTYESIYRELMP